MTAGTARADERAGYLISLSGIDGSGKSSLAERLCRALQRAGRTARIVRTMRRDPAFVTTVSSLELPPAAGEDWKLAREEFLASYLSWTLAVNAAEIVCPALARGEVVICDRYRADHHVSQAWFGVDISGHQPILATMPQPDVAFLVDCDPAVAQRRIDTRGAAGAGTGRDFLRYSREGFLRWFDDHPHVRLDGTLDPRTVLDEASAHVAPLVRQ
jgi:dTMP kinase